MLNVIPSKKPIKELKITNPACSLDFDATKMLFIFILFHVITLFLIYSENSKVRKEKARCQFINFHLYNVNMSILSQQRCSLLWKCWHMNRKASVKGLQMLFASYAFHLTTTSLWINYQFANDNTHFMSQIYTNQRAQTSNKKKHLFRVKLNNALEKRIWHMVRWMYASCCD